MWARRFARATQTPVIMVERPKGFKVPVVANLFASRDRIARMIGAPLGGFNSAWVRALANLIPPTLVSRAPVHEVVVQGTKSTQARCRSAGISRRTPGATSAPVS